MLRATHDLRYVCPYFEKSCDVKLVELRKNIGRVSLIGSSANLYGRCLTHLDSSWSKILCRADCWTRMDSIDNDRNDQINSNETRLQFNDSHTVEIFNLVTSTSQ